MRKEPAHLWAEHKVFRYFLRPLNNSLSGWQLVKAAIDLCRLEMIGVKGDPVCCFQFRWVEDVFPVIIALSRRADVHSLLHIKRNS
jgi:hypothetical protein